jgi:hypothetical protein
LIRPSADPPSSRPRSVQISDVDGVYGAWFEKHACEAVIVRPDWYLYGSATNGSDLRTLVQGLEDKLHPGRAAAA